MSDEEYNLVRDLLDGRIRQLRGQCRQLEELSRPVPEGTWRWADFKGHYSQVRKSEAELAADRASARVRLARRQRELDIALAARETLAQREAAWK